MAHAEYDSGALESDEPLVKELSVLRFLIDLEDEETLKQLGVLKELGHDLTNLPAGFLKDRIDMRRARLTGKVSVLKDEHDLPTRDPDREARMMEWRTELGIKYGLTQEDVIGFFEPILHASRQNHDRVKQLARAPLAAEVTQAGV